MTKRILIVEDTYSIALTYQKWLTSARMQADIAGSAEEAKECLKVNHYDGMVLDLNLPKMSGKEFLDSGLIPESCKVVMATSTGSIKTALEMIRAGAVDFLVKPFTKPALTETLNAHLANSPKASLQRPSQKAHPASVQALDKIKGESQPIQAIKKALVTYAPSSASVFITGESGTGKEFCAEALHELSGRTGAFIALNCAAIPNDLLESELFGHVKGAFSGAITSRLGAIKAAEGGTLFLDEICEMNINLQAKLLRFLENSKLRTLGSDSEEPIDVRIVCATNQDPQNAIDQNRFRSDLYYRLMVLPLELPPLRERGKDVLIIAQHLIEHFAKIENKLEVTSLTTDAEAALLAQTWGGNIRELANCIRRALLLSTGTQITADDLAPLFARLQPKPKLDSDWFNRGFDAIERDILEIVIAQCNGSLTKAAKQLQLSPSTLYRKREQWMENENQPFTALRDASSQ